LRMTWASRSASPAYFAGSRRASMQVRIAKPLGKPELALLAEPAGVGLVGCFDLADDFGH
jgi:hypothetical protein